MAHEPNICNDFDYPSSYTVCKLLRTIQQIHVYAGYGENHHECLNICWNHIDDEHIVQTIGEHIDHARGYTAAITHYYIL